MKKLYILSVMFLTAFAYSCNKNEVRQAEGVFETSFTGDVEEESKLYLDPSSYQIKFNMNDAFMTWAVQGTTKKAKSIYVTSKDGAEPVTFGSYSYTGLGNVETYYCAGTYMGSGNPGFDATTAKMSWTMPATQVISPSRGPTVIDDKGAVKSCIVLAAATEKFSSPQSEVSLHFRHMLAYANMKVTNLTLNAADSVKTIKLSSSKTLKSNICYYPLTGVCETTGGKANELTLDVSALCTATGGFNLVFSLPPVDLQSTSLKVTITTIRGEIIEGSVNIPAGKGNFLRGHLLPFVINCKNFKAKEFESASSAVKNMKVGWNCGNSLDSHGIACINNTKLRCGGDKLLGFETGWGNPKIKASLFPFVKQAGFDAVRLPVTWYPWMDENGDVDKKWMDRVEEVVNYILASDLYCILNVHHDAGSKDTRWLTADPSSYAAVSVRFKHLWEQIADRFKDYGPKLLFEGYNEILDANCNWDDTDADSYATANQLNQDFVDVVRASGGHNAERNLIVTTYSASAHKAPVEAFVLPTDVVNGRLIVETHIYAPYRFCFDQEDPEQDQKVFDSKGEEEAKRYLKIFNDNIASKGIPCILGEFGARPKDNDVERAKLATCYVSTAKSYGMVSFIWNTLINGDDRNTPAWTAPLVKDAMLAAVK